MVIIDGKEIHFGGRGYSDYILSGGDDKRKKAYIARHKIHEDWSKSGMNTPAFWARWILWSKSTLKESIKDAEKRFGIRIKQI